MKLLAKMSLPANPQTNWQNLAENTLLAASATGLTYVAENVSDMQFGNYSPLFVGIASVALFCIKKIIEIRNLKTLAPVELPINNPLPEPVPVPTPMPVVPEPIVVPPVVPTPVIRVKPVNPEEGSDFPLV